MSTLNIGTRILVVKATEKFLTTEGKRATVVDVDGSLIQAKTDDGTFFAFDTEGRLGFKVVEVTREDLAKDVQKQIDQLTADFNKRVESLNATITRLGFDTDEAYEKSMFKAAVLEAIKE